MELIQPKLTSLLRLTMHSNGEWIYCVGSVGVDTLPPLLNLLLVETLRRHDRKELLYNESMKPSVPEIEHYRLTMIERSFKGS